MINTKRERQVNFSSCEEEILVQLILENGHIVENKETDADMWQKKKEVWEKIDKSLVVSTGKYLYEYYTINVSTKEYNT